ncbi:MULTISPECIES: sigma-70 family RNA polymerase sigma factor [unclassified Nitratiruptor]|uniref:sigma-70 family RNA polymerase sigma factor n=1 Tax=unclassified Nitratiruptor TaxID=2624044 RepID=UPI001916095F|nr:MULTISPECIES: sigma-70 family RNA polymerase sigma factor [unclassified Nitratiruptor]BCD59918.1 RNA polymerase sigma factor for flagellar operon FliA [Nitratiruptor sp. YY08-10]BCD63841.1 RNA polymerase sigma factor for flagellar operon FliA [Nitratiruptor sp. YY08-14]
MSLTPQEKQQIVLDNLALVKKVASKIYFKLPKDANIEFDELVSTGTIGLYKAIEKYNRDKAQFSTYAYIKIRGEILDYLRSLHIVPRTMREKIKKEKEEGQKDIPLSNLAIMMSMEKALGESDNGLRLMDILISNEKSPEDYAISSEIHDKIVEALADLSESERKTLQMLYFEEREPKEVSQALGISQSRVSQIKSKAIAKLKCVFKKMEM